MKLRSAQHDYIYKRSREKFQQTGTETNVFRNSRSQFGGSDRVGDVLVGKCITGSRLSRFQVRNCPNPLCDFQTHQISATKQHFVMEIIY